MGFNLLDWLSLVWFAVCWFGYTRYSGFKSHRSLRLQDTLQDHIKEWIQVLHRRELRIVDTSVIANMERNATFFASSSLLIIAGLVTAIGATEQAVSLIADLPFAEQMNRERWEVGILLLVVIFAYAFFTFTWCMRQWGFASILVGSTSLADEVVTDAERARHAERLAQVVWLAIYHFNLGLRAYYFSLALLAWFVHPVVFVLASTWIVAVLYRREFRSRTLKALRIGIE